MKKGFIVFFAIIAMNFFACSSTPGNAFSYPEPIIASETAVFTGTGLKYSGARSSAIKEATSAGYTKILAEIIEIEGVAGMIQVTVVMQK